MSRVCHATGEVATGARHAGGQGRRTQLSICARQPLQGGPSAGSHTVPVSGCTSHSSAVRAARTPSGRQPARGRAGQTGEHRQHAAAHPAGAGPPPHRPRQHQPTGGQRGGSGHPEHARDTEHGDAGGEGRRQHQRQAAHRRWPAGATGSPAPTGGRRTRCDRACCDGATARRGCGWSRGSRRRRRRPAGAWRTAPAGSRRRPGAPAGRASSPSDRAPSPTAAAGTAPRGGGPRPPAPSSAPAAPRSGSAAAASCGRCGPGAGSAAGRSARARSPAPERPRPAPTAGGEPERVATGADPGGRRPGPARPASPRSAGRG